MDVNQEFNKNFREVGVAEFFRKNLQMLGYSGGIRSFTTIIHEFVTNGLDACEEYGILPEIRIKIKDVGGSKKDKNTIKLEKLQERLNEVEKAGKKAMIEKIEREIETVENEIAKSAGHYIVSVEDNGPGIPTEYIPKVFGSMLSGTKFHRYIQGRGQQGIGAVGAILFGQMTTGKPAKIISSTGNGKATVMFLKVDIEHNKAEVVEEGVIDAPGMRGTKIIAEFRDIIYRRSEQGPYEYLKRTALSNPHATIIVEEPTKEKTEWKRTCKEIPPLPKEMKPHPLGLLPDDLLSYAKRSKAKTISKFLESDLSRVSSNKAEEAMKKSGVEDKAPLTLVHSDAEKILKVFRDMKLLAPSTDGIVPIGEKYMGESLKKTFNAEFIDTLTRKPSVFRGGIPFQVEIGIAYGGESGRATDEGRKMEIMRFANKAPLLFDTGACGITKAIKSINWKNYNVGDIENSPITVFVNVISPHIPYKSAGKQSMDDDDDIIREIRFAIMDISRRLKRYLSGIKQEQIKVKRRSMFIKYAPEVAWALSILTGKNKEKILADLVDVVQKRVKLKEEQEAKLGEEKAKDEMDLPLEKAHSGSDE